MIFLYINSGYVEFRIKVKFACPKWQNSRKEHKDKYK